MLKDTVLAAEKPVERKPFNKKEYLLRFAQASFKELNAFIAQGKPDLERLEPELRNAVGEWLAKPTSEPDLGMMVSWRSKSKDKTTVERMVRELQAGFIAGMIKLHENPTDAATKYFYPLAEVLTGHPEIEVLADIRKKSVDALRIISRNWVLSQALDYADIDFNEYIMFWGGHNTRTLWSATGVSVLGRYGSIEDLPAIDVINEQCMESHMEGYCESARKRVIDKSVIVGMLSTNRELLLEAGFDPHISDELVADRLSPILDVIGVSYVIQALPGMKEFMALSPNPFIREMEMNEIISVVAEGLSRKFDGGVDGGSACEEHVHHYAAFKFAEENGLIKLKSGDRMVWWRDKYVLTDKGKTVIKALFQNINDIRIELTVPQDEAPDPAMLDILH